MTTEQCPGISFNCPPSRRNAQFDSARARMDDQGGVELLGLHSPPVVTLRCTGKLLARLRVKPATDERQPTSRLGDWHANLLYLPGGQVIIAVNDLTLLAVLIPASPGKAFVPRFREALPAILDRLGVAPHVIEREVEATGQVQFAATRSRVVLGSMNEFAFLLGARREWTGDLVHESLRLADTPCGPLKMGFPGDVTVKLLGAGE